MRESQKFEAFISSMHAWRRQPGDALQAVAETLKLPSCQANLPQKKAPLWQAVEKAIAAEAYGEALAEIAAALAAAKQAGDRAGEALAIYLESHVQVLQEDRKAIEGLSKSLECVADIYHEAGATKDEEDVLKDLIEWHLVNSQKQEAEVVEKRLLEILKASKEEPVGLLQLASVYFSTGDLEKAKGHVDQAMSVFGSQGNKAGQAMALRALAVLYLSQQRFDAAIKALEQALQTQDDKAEKANLQYGLSQIYCAMGGQGLNQAFSALKDGRSLMKQAGNEEGELEILQIVQELHMNNKQGAEAVAAGKDALAVSQASGNKKKEAQAFLRLVSASLASQNDAEALKFAEEAENKARDADDIISEAQATSNIGEILLRRGDRQAAVTRSRQLLATCRERNHSAGQASAMVVLGSALLAEHTHSAEGMRCLQDALKIFKSSDDFVGLYSAHFALANSFFTRGDLEDGLYHAREVLSCCRRNGDKVNEDLVKQNIEKARQMAAQMRMSQAKRPSIENAGILLSSAGPQACKTKYSRVPGSLLNVVAAGRNYWGTPRQVQNAAAEADERPPSHCVVWSHPLSDCSPSQMCLDFMMLVGAMAKGDVPKLPIVVQTRGVMGRYTGDLTVGTMTNLQAVTLWGLLRTVRQEIAGISILALDFAPGMTTQQIPRQLKPPVGVAETAYYNKMRWEPQLAAVHSLLRRDLKRDNLAGGAGGPQQEQSDTKASTKFTRKAFSWTGPSIKMDFCWYRQEWKSVGAAEGEIIVKDPVVPVRPLRQY